jgi:YD repeat-containing protein
VINLLPLKMEIELDDNKLVSYPGATTTGGIILNAAPSAVWFPSLSMQTSSTDVNVVYDWPPGYTNGTSFTLSVSGDVTTAFPVTINAEIDSSNGIKTTGSAQLSVQPPGDPGTCDDDCNKVAGGPINVSTGNVWIQEKDYSLPGLGHGLQLTRTWNSKWQNLAPPAVAGLFGHSWLSNFEEQLFFPDPNSITYYRGDGSSWVFNSSGQMISPPLINAGLSSAGDQYTLTLPDGTQRTFNAGGRLLAITDRNGNQTTVAYDSSNRLSAVTDAAGRSLTFSYGDPNNPYQATAVQDAVGLIANYAYDSSSRLLRVTYLDGSSLNFAYGSSSMITSVTDGQGKVLESHTYDAADRGLTSSRAGGADLVTVDFSTPALTQLNDSVGNSTAYSLHYEGGRMRVDGISGPGCASCGGRGNGSFVYDGVGRTISSTHALGNLTCYTYDLFSNIASKDCHAPRQYVPWVRRRRRLC